MSGDGTAQMVFLMTALLLPLSALMARRLPLSATLKLALIWLAIFAGGAFLVAALAQVLGYNLT